MPQFIPVIIAAVKVVSTVATIVSAVSQVASLFIKPKGRGGRGNAGLALMIRETDYPRRFLYGRGRLGGIWFYAETEGDSNEMLWLVLGISEGLTAGQVCVYFNDDEIKLEVTGQDANGVDIYEPVEALTDEEEEDGVGKYKGTASFTFYHGDQTQADARLVEASNEHWTENCLLLGISYCVVKIEFDSELYSGGVPEISFLWDGCAEVYDLRDESTGFSDNSALCLAHYMTRPRTGPAADFDTEINALALTTAANVCDEEVTTIAGSEKRYTTDGVISLGQGPESNIAAMLSAMSGFTSYAGGQFTIGAAAWSTPTFDLNLDHIIRIERFQNKSPKRNRVNTVKGLYVSASNLYQSSDFPTRTKSSYVEEDGEELVFDLDLQMTESPARAQRLANIELEEGRFERKLQLDCTLEAFRAQAGKVITVTIDRYGLNRAPFLVENFSFSVGESGELMVQLSLKETSSTIYDWSVSDEVPVVAVPVLVNEGIKVSEIIADPLPGQYLTSDFPMTVELSTLTDEASIRWSHSFIPENVGSATEYTGAVEVGMNEPLIAKAFKDDYSNSSAFIGVYSVEQVERPTMSPQGGSFAAFEYPVAVTVSTVTPSSSIRWKVGSAPSSETDGNLYTGPIDANSGEEIFVRAFKTGLVDSDSTSGSFLTT